MIATQNPVDQEGTYPLSEAQTDRFMLKDVVSYPSPEQEVEVMDRMDAGLYDKDHRSRPVVGLDDVRRLQDVVRHVHMDRALMRYASELVAVTRDSRPVPARELARLDRIRREPARNHRVLQNRTRTGDAIRPRPRRFPTTSPNSPTACCGTGSSSASRRPAARHSRNRHRRGAASGPGAVEVAVGKHLDRAKAHFGTDTRGLLEGGRYALLHNRSLEFDDLRPYVRGDDVRDIDWKASARSGGVLIKRFVDEKHHKILLVADAGRNMTALAPSGERKSMSLPTSSARSG